MILRAKSAAAANVCTGRIRIRRKRRRQRRRRRRRNKGNNNRIKNTTTTTNVIIICDNKSKRHHSKRATVQRRRVTEREKIQLVEKRIALANLLCSPGTKTMNGREEKY